MRLGKLNCLILSIFLLSCSLSNHEQVPTRAELAKQREIENPSADVLIQPFSSEELKQTEKEYQYVAEIVWDIPSEPVDAFIIYSGATSTNLNTEIHLAVKDLEVIEGNKYRYILKSIDQVDELYISLAAVSKGQVSERSAIQKLEQLGMQSSFNTQQ